MDDDFMELMDSDPEDSVEENLNNLLRINSVDQGYYVALFLQRIISSGELNVLNSGLLFNRTNLPDIKYGPVLNRLKSNSIYQAVLKASGQFGRLQAAPARRSAVAKSHTTTNPVPTTSSSNSSSSTTTTTPATASSSSGSGSGNAAAAASKAVTTIAKTSSVASSSPQPQNPPMPPITPQKHTASAAMPSLMQLLAQRERGVDAQKFGCFSQPQCCAINNLYMPNYYKTQMSLDSKVYCGAMSPKGRRFVTASQDHVLRVYDASNDAYKRVNRTVPKDVHWGVLDIAFTSDEEYFVYSTWSKCLQVASCDDPSKDIQCLDLDPVATRFCIFSIDISPCDQYIIGGSNDGHVYMFDRLANRRTMCVPVTFQGRTIVEERSDVNAAGFFDETSNIFYAGMDNGAIRVWDRRTIDDSRNVPIGYFFGHVDGVTHIESKRDGRYIISNSKDQSIKLWDIRKIGINMNEREAIRTRRRSQKKFAWDYRWDEVPLAFYDASVSPRQTEDNSIMTYRGHRVRKSLLRARFSPAETTGQRYIYTGSATGHLIVYDLLTGAIVTSLNGHYDVVRDVAWHPQRQEILTSSWDGTVNLNRYREQDIDLNAQGERKSVRSKRRRLNSNERSMMASLQPSQQPSRRSRRIAEQLSRL